MHIRTILAKRPILEIYGDPAVYLRHDSPEPGETKNGHGRTIPLANEVVATLRHWNARTHLRHPACPWVCHYYGQRLQKIPKRMWRQTCERVGLNVKLFHDLRRTAVRNMVRAGISERVAMEISGHRTRAVFDRYDIVNEADLSNAIARLQQSVRLVEGKHRS